MKTPEELMREQQAKALVKMCRIVGADISEIDFKKPDWYHSHSWTRAQHDEYVKWFAGRLMKDRRFRKAFMEIPSTSMAQCYKAAESFAIWYGWKFSDEGVDK